MAGPSGDPAARPVVRDATADDLAAWDARAVHGPGGHVYQSRTWAQQRARLGWQPRFLIVGDGHPALVLLRPVPWIGGATAYVPRGPVAAPDDPGAAIAARQIALADELGRRGVDVVAMDPEVPAATDGLRTGLAVGGFHPIPEIQPSRHRVSLPLPDDADEDSVRAGATKSTRQRIAAAERDGSVVARYDTAGWPGSVPLFGAPVRPVEDALEAFATLLEGTGQRRGFRFGPRAVFLDWWRAAHAAGLLVLLEARDATDPRPLGGLILYRHGTRLTTVHSADAPGIRESHPGVMHLLRWRAIQLALREGRTEMDLGGVDVGPEHLEPRKGDPMAGLYEHKRSFGATWVEMIGAQERILRPWHHRAGRVTARLARVLPMPASATTASATGDLGPTVQRPMTRSDR